MPKEFSALPCHMSVIDGDGLEILIQHRAGAILACSLETLANLGRLAPEGEILRYSYQPSTDPELPDAPPESRKLLRILVQEIPATPQDAHPRVIPGRSIGDVLRSTNA